MMMMQILINSRAIVGNYKMQRNLLLSSVHQQSEANQDDEQIDIGGLVPRLVHGVVQRFLALHNPMTAHCDQTIVRQLFF